MFKGITNSLVVWKRIVFLWCIFSKSRFQQTSSPLFMWAPETERPILACQISSRPIPQQAG